MVLDSIRTIVIWGVSLLLGWESFQWLLMGFCVVIWDVVYNEIVLSHLSYIIPKEMQEALLPLRAQTGARHHFSKRDYREGGTEMKIKKLLLTIGLSQIISLSD